MTVALRALAVAPAATINLHHAATMGGRYPLVGRVTRRKVRFRMHGAALYRPERREVLCAHEGAHALDQRRLGRREVRVWRRSESDDSRYPPRPLGNGDPIIGRLVWWVHAERLR